MCDKVMGKARVSRGLMRELKKFGLVRWECGWCDQVEFTHPDIRHEPRKFCNQRCAELFLEWDREEFERFVKVCGTCGVEFRTTVSVDADFCSSECRSVRKLSRVTMTCSGCGNVRQYTPSAAAKCKSDLCRVCHLKLRKLTNNVTIVCPDCGVGRTSRRYAASKRKSDRCFKCMQANRSKTRGEVSVACPCCDVVRKMTKRDHEKRKTDCCFKCAQAKRTENAYVVATCSDCGKERRLARRYYDMRKTDRCRKCSQAIVSKYGHSKRTPKLVVECGSCGKETRNKKYCSVACKHVGLTKVRICAVCGKETGNKKYCSAACRHVGLTRKFTKLCGHCGEEFATHISNPGKYCCVECKYKGASRLVSFVCPVCDKECRVRPSVVSRGRLTCSDACGMILKSRKALEANAKLCPVCGERSSFGRNVFCKKCGSSGNKNVAKWRKAATRAVVAHGNKKWRYTGKGKSTLAICGLINEHFPVSYSFLSMPHIGRELSYLSELTNIDLANSLGVENDKQTYVALQAVVNKYFESFSVFYRDIDELCVDIDLRFDVAHLDYCGPLTRKRIGSINALVGRDVLTFFTVARSHRFRGSISDIIQYPAGDPPINGRQLLCLPYLGNQRHHMELYAYRS